MDRLDRGHEYRDEGRSDREAQDGQDAGEPPAGSMPWVWLRSRRCPIWLVFGRLSGLDIAARKRALASLRGLMLGDATNIRTGPTSGPAAPTDASGAAFEIGSMRMDRVSQHTSDDAA